MKLHLLEAAKAELREVVAYYNELSTGLGDELLREVEEALAAIEAEPLRFGKMETLPRRNDVRRALLAGFPYYVPFQTVGDEILIVAVAHVSRKPNYWRRRLRP